MRTSGVIPNLVNGVSQQAPALRLPSQAEFQENFMPSLVEGLVPRPPTEWVAEIMDGFPAGTFVHMIYRDEAEQYVVFVLPSGAIRVFDHAGDEKIVNNLGASYLAGLTNPEEQLRALTIADYTFIVNRTTEVAPGTATSPDRPYEALYYVSQGNYSKTYKIIRGGATAASYAVPDSSDVSHEPYVDTVYIASQLFSGLAVNGDQAKGRYGSTVYFRDITTDFTTSVEDGFGGRAFKAAKGKIQRFSDLPTEGPDGFTIEVQGSDTTGFDNYWVTLTQGVWKESVAPGTILGLDETTMPHTLVREADGSFTFRPATWADRKCGNVERNPDPSFVGQTIQDVFFHRNRLGFLTAENTVLSESGQFFNFYRVTLTASLDTDPIDTAATHTKVSLLKHAVPIRDQLVLFSEQTQFRLSGNELFTPKTVSARPLTELNSSPAIRPVVSKSDIYFVTEQDGHAQLQEYYLLPQGDGAEVDTATAHVPAYIPAGVYHMASSPELSLLVSVSSAQPNRLYVYKYLYKNNEKLQAAWSYWSFPEADRLVAFQFRKSFLEVLVLRHGVVHLERINCESRLLDPELGFTVYLDERVKVTPGDGFVATYDVLLNRTTITLPFQRPSGARCVTTLGGPQPPGVELTLSPTQGADTAVVLNGDMRDQPFYLGIPYESRYRFSRFYHRKQSQQASGRTLVDENGRLQIGHLNLTYSRTARFKVEVTPAGRNVRTYEFNGRRVSEANNQVNQLVLTDGHMSVPILSRNDRVVIDLVSESWHPCAFEGAEWTGTFHPATREL